MKKIMVGFILALCVLLVPLVGHTETFWNFGFGMSSYSCGGYYGSSCVTYQPVVPVMPVVPYGYSTTVVVGAPSCYVPRPWRCYCPYGGGYRGYYHPRRYYYGGANHPAPPPVHCRTRHYWPNGRWHHPGKRNRCNIHNRKRRW